MKTKMLILISFILAKFVIQYNLISPEYDLHRDEYLHLDQARHLAWGYLSVPPVTSWISYIIALLGNGEFWVKFFPCLFGALTIVMVWQTIEELDGGLFALVLGGMSILFSALLRINLLYQPNSLDILLWTTIYFLYLKYIRSENRKWLYILSVVSAFAFLNKYNIIFLFLGLFPALLFSPHRQLFTNRHFYLSLALSLLLVLPNLLWQYQHDFPVVWHMNQLAKTQLVNVNRLDFLKEQVLFFMGSFFVIIAGLFALLSFPTFKPYRVFFWSFLFSISLFVYFRAKGYYGIGLYPILIGFGSVYLEKVLQSGWKQYLQPVLLAIPVLLLIPIYRVAFPNKSPVEIQQNAGPYKRMNLLRWEDGKDHALPQDFADMLGWRELAHKVDSTYSGINDKEHTLVLCDNYGQAGAINYYSEFETINAVSFNADYINWIPLSHDIKHVILVKETDDDDPDRVEEKPLFEHVLQTGRIENQFAREYRTRVFLLYNAKIDINKRISDEVFARKKAQK